MSDDKISSNAAIDAALHLDGDPRTLKQYYADWALNYNSDIDAAKYAGPDFAARLLSRHLDDKSARILDAGCGTGLVGVALQTLGYRHIDGFDLSPEMARQAKETGAYGAVADNVDMMRAPRDYPHAGYDALLSIGVFTLGHVPPQALAILLQLLRDGGLLVVSTRSHYFEQTDYQQCVDELLSARRLRQLEVIRDAPYNHDGDAHYWVFAKTG